MRIKISSCFGQHTLDSEVLGALSIYTEPFGEQLVASAIPKLVTLYREIATLALDHGNQHTLTGLDAIIESEPMLDDAQVWHVFFVGRTCCFDRARDLCSMVGRVTRKFFAFVEQLGIEKAPTDLRHYGFDDNTNEGTRH